jgi:hypothetical protein
MKAGLSDIIYQEACMTIMIYFRFFKQFRIKLLLVAHLPVVNISCIFRPLFLVGKPGSSKSLAKTIVADAMQGDSSRNDFFKRYKQVRHFMIII